MGMVRFINTVMRTNMFNLEQRRIIDDNEIATLYSLTDHWVIRKSKLKIDGFLVIYNLTEKERVNFNLPFIDKMNSSIPDKIIVIERLYKPDPEIFKGIEPILNNLNSIFSINSNLNYNKFKLTNHLNRSHHLYSIIQNAIKLHKYLKSKNINSSLHLTPENIMMRGTGVFVLSNPINKFEMK